MKFKLFSLTILMLGLLAFVARITNYQKPVGAAEPKIRNFEFSYKTTVKDIPAGARTVNIWLPYPTSDENQKITDIKIQSPYPWLINKDPEYGNSILFIPINEPKDSAVRIEMRFKVERQELLRKGFDSNKTKPTKILDGNNKELNRWLRADKMVPIDARVKQLAVEVVNGKTKTDFEKARAIYDYAVSTLKYDKSGTGWGRGDIYYACDVKKGNCTDFHAVFIGFCRALGIPAKFEMGFPLPAIRGEGGISGYHCWAEFYSNVHGWVPVDCSEASKDPAKKEYFFGAHDENRVLFTVGRDLTLEPRQKGEKLNFFIYPYVEVDGKVFTQVDKNFYFKDLALSANR